MAWAVLTCMCGFSFWMWLAILLADGVTTNPTTEQGVTQNSQGESWEVYSTSQYMFILDTVRNLDQTRHESEASCQMRGARLASIETTEELDYIKRKIEKHVTEMGQEFANEQWWTSGEKHFGTWTWENGNKTPVSLPVGDKLVRRAHGHDRYLALTHGQDGWTLQSVPPNYKLRYICEKAMWTAGSRPPEEKLLTMLFKNYDTDARGTAGYGKSVNVSVEFMLLRIQDVDERRQVLTTMGLIIAEWTDERLRWTPSVFDNISTLVVRADRVWLPELAIMNGAEEHVLGDFDRVRVLLSSSGRVHWEPGGIFHTTCDIDMRYFPFDQQECAIKVGAWAYYSTKVNLTSVSPVIEMADFSLNGEWELYQTSANWRQTSLPCCPDMNYPYVEFRLWLRRRHVFYIINLIVPCVLLSILVMALFWVPHDAGEKVTGGVAVLCAFTVFLLLLADIVPRTSLQVPIIVIYLTCTMTLGTLSVCFTILVLSITHNHPRSRPPEWLRNCFRLNHKPNVELLSQSDPDDRMGPKTNSAEAKEFIGQTPECTENMINTEFSRDSDLGHGRIRDKLHHRRSRESIRITRQEENDGDGFQSLGVDTFVLARREWRRLAKCLDRLFFVVVFILMLFNALLVLLSPWYRT